MTEKLSVQATAAIEEVLEKLAQTKAAAQERLVQDQAIASDIENLQAEAGEVSRAAEALLAASEELKAFGLGKAAQEASEAAQRALESLQRRIEQKECQREGLGLTEVERLALTHQEREAERRKQEATRQQQERQAARLKRAQEWAGEQYAMSKAAADQILAGAEVKSVPWERVRGALDAAIEERGLLEHNDVVEVVLSLTASRAKKQFHLSQEEADQVAKHVDKARRAHFRQTEKHVPKNTVVTEEEMSHSAQKWADIVVAAELDEDMKQEVQQQLAELDQIAERVGQRVSGEVKMSRAGTLLLLAGGKTLKLEPGIEAKLF